MDDIAKEDVADWLKKHRTGGGDHMTCMKALVGSLKDKSVSLKNPDGAKWVICDLHATVYKNNEDEVNGWEKFYLPDEVKMQVIGEVTGTSCPCKQLVLMTCKDGNIYAFDGEELHVVASSVEKLCAEGLQYPASLSYYKGQAFRDLTDEDWNKVKQSEVGKSLDRAHDTLVNAHKSRFLESLKNADRGKEKELEAMRPSSGHSSSGHSSSGHSSSEREVVLLMRRLEREIENYVLEKSRRQPSSGVSSSADRVRLTLDELEKEIENDMRQKSGLQLSSGDSSSEGRTQMLTKESEKGKQWSWSFGPSSESVFLATKRGAEPGRASRVEQIMEEIEDMIEVRMRHEMWSMRHEMWSMRHEMWSMSSSDCRVQSLMEELRREIEDDVQQRLGLKSVNPSLGDSSPHTKTVLTPEREVDLLMRRLEWEIKKHVWEKYERRPSSEGSSSADKVRLTLDELEKEIENDMRQKSGLQLSSGDSSSEGRTQMLTEESEKGKQQSSSFGPSSESHVLATKRWAEPGRASRVGRIMEEMEHHMRHDMWSMRPEMLTMRHEMLTMSSSDFNVQSLMEELRQEIEDNVRKKLGLKSVIPSLGDSSPHTKAVLTPAEKVEGKLES